VARSGQIIDERYRLNKRIAAGGVGQVWLATDSLLERPVAVKLLRPEHSDHPATLARFRKEARHAGALSHPCVAQVFDYGHVGPGGPPYLVMEFVDGPSLADLLAVDPVEPEFALDVIAQAASGLHAAHQIGLVHRDVKPGNILIGPDGRVKITDFGIAYAAGQTPITAPGLVMGTTQYMAPERIAGGGPGTPSSDLYALGIVLHECLTGLPPYEGTPAEVMAGHLHAALPPLPVSVPPELNSLIARLTAKDPAARLGDASDLAALAARLRDSVAAGQPGRANALVGAGQVQLRRPVLAAGPAARDTAARTPASLATLPAGPVRRPQPQPHQVPDQQEPAGCLEPVRKRRRAAAIAAAATVLAGAVIAALLVSGVLNAAPSAYRAPEKPSKSHAAPTLGVVPAPAGRAGGGYGSGSMTGAAPSATATATSHRARHGRAAGGRSTSPATPTTTTNPAPGSSPTPSGPASITPTPTPTDQPGSPSPTPSPTPSGILPSLPIPVPTLNL
jgi:eukaryotic-like serine/threonine-protein kinase